MDILLEPRDLHKAARFRAANNTCMLVAQDLTNGLAPTSLGRSLVEKPATFLASQTLGMKNSVPPCEAPVLDRFLADGARVGSARDERVRVASSFGQAVPLEPGIELTNILQKLGQAVCVAGLALELEGALQTYANEKLEVVRQTCDEREQLLRDP